jgi:hypothetical protein
LFFWNKKSKAALSFPLLKKKSNTNCERRN